MSLSHPQDLVHQASLDDPETFWSYHASQLHWHKPPSRALLQTSRNISIASNGINNPVSHPSWSWFPDGEISTVYNCIDRHVKNGLADHPALVWESPVTSAVRQTYTYSQLLDEVSTLAGVLREEGVKKGDVVLVYMPMVPAAIFGLLAIARLGAVHAAVFGGFASASLAQRIDASNPVAILTASCGIEGAKGPLAYRPLVLGAIALSKWKPAKIIVWQRDEARWNPVDKNNGERNWQRLVKSARSRGVYADTVPVKSGDPLYIIYTSGTTGLPKGVVREAGGHAVGLSLSTKQVFDVKGPGDCLFCASDIGWVVGHSYIVYGPLLNGATSVFLEGKPVGTPDAGTYWRIVERNKVTSLFTSPTALRAIRKDDEENKFFEHFGRRGGLRSLRGLFLAGERSEPSIVSMYQKLLNSYAAPNATVVDNWWSSESGSPITGIALRADLAAVPRNHHSLHNSLTTAPPLEIKLGSAGKPLPGFDVKIVTDEGEHVAPNCLGNIVLGIPLAPTAFLNLYNDPSRFYKGYLLRFQGRYLDTGDSGFIDADGYVHVMSRSDDVINVAAHRFSTGAIEQALLSHPSVGEACVVGIPDDLKGHMPFAFIQLSGRGSSTSGGPISVSLDPKLFQALNAEVRSQIGAIAALGGAIQGQGMIPKTRSGKTLRRVLRELLENAVNGEPDKEVNVPPTVEDAEIVEVARERIKTWVAEKKAQGTKAKL